MISGSSVITIQVGIKKDIVNNYEYWSFVVFLMKV